MGMELRLVQLLRGSAEFAWLRQDGAFAELARVADGVGPSMHMIVEQNSSPADIRLTGLVEMAHASGMQVHPYTFRRDAGAMPAYASSFEDLLDIFLYQVGVDGVFTDFPDLAVDFIASKEASTKSN